MWYKTAQKINSFGFPISSGEIKTKQFQSEEPDLQEIEIEEQPQLEPESDDTQVDENGVEIPVIQPNPGDVSVDSTITPEDLQQKVIELEADPTKDLKLPPLHKEPEDPNCYCRIESKPILSQPGINDARRVWIVNHFNNETGKPINNCPVCLASADNFNRAEVERLRNKGIDVDPIP
jgi:hypothetical protein